MEGSLLIDVSRLMARFSDGRKPTGIDRVCLAYLARYGARSQAVMQKGGWRRIAPYGESQALFSLMLDPDKSFFRKAALIVARACMPPWPSQEGRGRPYLNPGHTGMDRAGMAAWLRRTGQKPVFMVHDLIPVTNPEYCRAGERERHVARLRNLLGVGAGVLANSEFTLDQLTRFARDENVPLPEMAVAPLAPGLAARPAEQAPLPHPYFVVVGTIEPRKNHLMLLKVWQRLIESMGSETPHLVVIGQRGWHYESVVDLMENSGPLRGFVHELGNCSDSQLATWLGHARAMVFPSLAEGYGIPLVESLMLGTPVIASTLPVFREIAGEIPDYLDPLDEAGWAQAARDYAQPGSERRQAQVKRIAGFVTPTWDIHFERVEALLDRLQ